jgi:hypothetical protein
LFDFAAVKLYGVSVIRIPLISPPHDLGKSMDV